MRMTQRERLLAPFHGVKPDRPAWLADLSYWHEASASAGTLGERYRGTEGYKLLHEDLGVCYYYDYSSRIFDCSFEGVDFTTVESSGERTRTWRTPVGQIAEHWRYLKSAWCWAHDCYAVRSQEDLRVLLDVWERTRFLPCPDVYARLDAWIGEAGLPLAPAPRSPLPALLADWCGVEGTVFLIADHEDLVSDILAAIDRANDAAFEALVASPCQLVHFCDNLDSSASTPFFDRWMREYYEKRVAQLHRAGKFAVVHLDGRVRGLLPRLAGCGFDAVESITPAPVGDVKIEELRAVAGNGSTIIWGGVPGAMFCTPWGANDVRRQTKQLLQSLGADGRLIVGSADQIPPNGDTSFCRLIADIVEAWDR
jgi:hypothetical protein